MQNDKNTNTTSLWEDESFLDEIKSRIEDIESSESEGFSWDEVKQRAKSEFDESRNSNRTK